MFEKRIPLFSLFGFKVSLDLTWIILAVLITWSLAEGAFPAYFKGFSTTTYWWMGVAGAIGLFFSIVFHEFCHSLVARQFGLEMKGITLFIFGGVAEMQDEPASAKAEFFMAVVGPISSLVLAGIFYVIQRAGQSAGMYKPVGSVLLYMAWLNMILAIFNMVPAFPLDGGRVLRSILWAIKGNLRWATHIASQLGAAFGWLLIILGVVSFIGGNFIGGLWYLLIGMFIRGASHMSYRQMLMRKALAGETVERFMERNVVTVSPDINVSELVEDYFYRYHYAMFPVQKDGQLIGCVTTRQVKELPREKWNTTTVADIASGCAAENTVSKDTDAMKALSLMNSTTNTRLMVLDGNNLVGIVTLKDLLQFFALKIDLEESK
jgi:Zn-dependent protease/predicted transcriptional regulator